MLASVVTAKCTLERLELSCGIRTLALDPQPVGAFVSAVRAGSRRLRDVDERTLLRRRCVLEPEGDRVTLADLYALGEYPQQYARKSRGDGCGGVRSRGGGSSR